MAAMLGLHMATTPLNGFPPTATSQMAAGARPAGPPQTPRHRPISLNSAGNRTTVPGRTAARIPAASATNGGDGIAVDAPFSPSPLLPIPMGRRGCLAASAGLLASLSLTAGAAPARAAVLEADDDVELLEKVKQDRKKRLERQGVISSSGRETGYLQALVYTLSKVGQAIDNNDLSAAGTILGANANSEWLQNGNAAFAKEKDGIHMILTYKYNVNASVLFSLNAIAFYQLSSSPEEKIEVDNFNTSLVALISSVANKDVESSKVAFVTSASALEKWVTLTGLVGKLSGL